MPIQLVVFDMAGTTVKDRNYVGQAFQGALSTNGYDLTFQSINPVMGYEKSLAIRMILDQFETNKDKITPELIHQIHTEFTSRMKEFYETSPELAPLPNVESTFDALHSRGIKVALDTGFSAEIAGIIIRRLGWVKDHKVDFVIGSDEVERGRPAPDMIHRIMEALGISSPESVAKVGDTEVDVKEGLNSGCRFVIGVTTGTFSREALLNSGPTHVIDDIFEVVDIVTKE